MAWEKAWAGGLWSRAVTAGRSSCGVQAFFLFLFFCQGGRHSTLLLAKKAWLELEESLNKLYEWRLGWTHAVGQVKLGGA